MKSLLEKISEKAIKYEDFNFSFEQKKNKWLGNNPASEREILETEIRLGITLPNDYKEFLLVTNGFSAPNDIEPTFASVEKIDFLKNVDEFIIEAYGSNELENCIVIAGFQQEQYFLLIPPKQIKESWKYWKFANWLAGEYPFENLESYFLNVLEFIESEHESN